MLGHSFGGNVALEYALRYPQSLSLLILLNTGGDQGWVNQNAPDLLAKRGYDASVVQADRRFYSGQITPDEHIPTAMKFMSAYFHPIFLFEAVRGIFSPGPSPRMRAEPLIFGYNQLLYGWTVMDRLSEIKMPTLVIAGREDILFSPEH